MTPAVFLIFLGAGADSHDAELEAWARARQVRLEIPERDSAAPARYPPDVVRQIEELLDQARLDLAARADASARAGLERVERLLRDHPELPQAAWLMAERWELGAAAAELSPDGASEGARLRNKRRVLEPERAPTFGEPARADAKASTRKLRIEGLASGDRLYWNGVESSRQLSIAVGEHHARVLRRGRSRWSGWVTVGPEARRVELPVPPPSACSLDDIGSVRIDGDRVIAPASAECERWAVARTAAAGGIEIASCRRSQCGPLFVWRTHYGSVYDGPPQPAPSEGFPAWATWTLIGVGSAVVGGVVAWRAGAFDERERPAPTWRFYGP